jgi:hypothetical protein
VRLRAVTAAALVLCATAACAQPGYDASKLDRQLRDAGATDEQARCVTAGLENSFDLGQLASRTNPTAKERETTRVLLDRCGVRLRPQP